MLLFLAVSFWCWVWLSPVLSAPPRVRLVTMSIGSGSPRMGYEIVTSAVDAALASANRTFPEVVTSLLRTNYFVKGQYSCAEAEAYTTAGLHILLGDKPNATDTQEEIRVVIAPGCSFEIIDLGEFAREADVLVMASTASVDVLKDKTRFPTLLALAAVSFADAIQAAYAFVVRNRWSRVNLFCQKMSPNSTRAYANVASEVLCGIATKTLQVRRDVVNSVIRTYDPEDLGSFRPLLTHAKRFSTVSLFITESPDFMRLLWIADELGMDTGEYVFLMFPWDGFSAEDQAGISRTTNLPVSLAFAFIGSFGDVSWSEVYSEVCNRSAADYGYNVPRNVKPQIPVLSAFESAYMLVEVVSRSFANTKHFGDRGGRLADRNSIQKEYEQKRVGNLFPIPGEAYYAGRAHAMLNETWPYLSAMSGKSLASRFFGRSFRLPTRTVSVARDGTRVCDIIFKQFHMNRGTFETVYVYLSLTKKIAPDPNGSVVWNKLTFPPSVFPVCGFDNERCQNNDHRLIVIAGSCGAILALILVVAALLIYMKRAGFDQSQWWYLPADFVRAEDNEIVYPITGIAISPCFHGQVRVWCRSEMTQLTEQQIRSTKAVRSLLAQVRHLRSDSVARFYGLVQSEKHISVVWEYGRGSLRSLYANVPVMSDRMLRKFLVFNVLSGLHEIHSSPLRFHGSLSSLTVMVDNRFSAKIIDVSSLQVFRVLSKKIIVSDADYVFPPESIKNDATLATPEADIFALGIIIKELACEMKSSEPTNAKQETVKREAQFSEALKRIVDQCGLLERKKRPTTKVILNQLSRFQPKGTVVQSLLQRLEDHAENLEIMVAIKTAEYMAERQKADALLAEIMPRMFVKQLRNKIPVLPQLFDAATILFSSVVGFGKFCSEAAPLEVGAFLDDLYMFMDGLLEGRDLYKVETIKDGYIRNLVFTVSLYHRIFAAGLSPFAKSLLLIMPGFHWLRSKVASGLPMENGERHAYEVALLAVRIFKRITAIASLTLPIRIGIHTGPIAAGIVGNKMPRYCLFGDTMNMASRMESHGEASRIHISSRTYKALHDSYDSFFQLERRGIVEVKGKGPVETFWVHSFTPPTHWTDAKPLSRPTSQMDDVKSFAKLQ